MQRFSVLIIWILYLSPNFIQAQSVIESDSLEQTDSIELVIGYYESPPFILENEDGELEGISVTMWQRIARDLNLSYRFEKMPLEQVLANLQAGQVDIAINPLTVTSERSLIVDFSPPYYVSHSSVVIRKSSSWQKALQYVYSILSLSFLRAILALFGILFLFGVLVWIFERSRNPEEFQPGWRGIASGIWWSAVTMTTVGYGDKSPRTFGGRLIGLIWMFAAIIMISGFTASIASSLTVNQLGWQQNEIEDFKESQVGTVEGSATQAWLKKKFFKEVESSTRLGEGLAALQDGKLEAFVYDEPLLIYLLNQDETYGGLEKLPIRFNLQFYSVAFSEDIDPMLREKISRKVLEITEAPDWEVLLAEYGLSVI